MASPRKSPPAAPNARIAHLAIAISILSLNEVSVESFGSTDCFNHHHSITPQCHSPLPHSPHCTPNHPTLTSIKPTKSIKSSTALPVKKASKETDSQIRDRILSEIDSGIRSYPSWVQTDYGEPEQTLVAEDDDDPNAIDPTTLGQWDESDFEDKFDYEWDAEEGDEDPNNLSGEFEYVEGVEVDEEGIEVGWDPIFGESSPFDERTIINPPDSYVIDERTRDDRLVPKDFPDGDPEIEINEKITQFRKSLKQVETYTEPFLKMEVPLHTAKWHGYPEQLSYPKKDYHNNRFTNPKDRTDFDALGPARARQVAVQMARSKNNEWLPAGVSAAYHARKTAIYKEKGVLAGSTLKGECDPHIVSKIQPALDVLGDVVELLSIEMDTVFRFKYHGLIKNKRGMEAWAGVLIRNCDVDCTGVVFETGFRKRDPWYDGGDHWYGPY